MRDKKNFPEAKEYNMTKELSKIYSSADHEDAIYDQWEKSGFFNPDNLKGEPYSIMMPPPNVTGVLHLGHALENSLMDIMARYQRMKGKKVLLLPGTDHSAVATQAKVEKFLVAEGITNPRQELGREKLLAKIRDYAANSQATILKQIKKMGTSCDWSRLAYTFDQVRGRAVNQVFIKMYNDGLIYRGKRAVNWSVKGQSTCSDDELVHLERPATLYTLRYAKDFPIAVATTRPETKLGDTAVAVNPKDKRYKKHIGKVFTVKVGASKPLEIKIIADEAVDQNFGSGAVGVTPAHSLIDFEMYERQKARSEPIGLVQVIGQDGRMTDEAGKDYAGLTVLEAREKFVSWLRSNGLLEKAEEIMQNVGTSDRFGDAVEVLPMTQWFVNVNKKIPGKNKSLKDLMRRAVTTGHNNDPKQKVKITPERFAKVYLNWIDNLRDWCISRQIWWGHRIPVWYCGGRDKGKCLPECQQPIVAAETPKQCQFCGSQDLIQDEDTLDTWFSSGLWTFSTLGWPDKTQDLKTFHPTNWMQMGYEILFFWLARMILMSVYVLDQIPFKDVYIHGILRNEAGKKFSKSSDNNIDPLEIAAKYGMDALRLSLISGIAPGNDSKFYEEKVEGARNLVNKFWNISRYILSNIKKGKINFNVEKLTIAEDWILIKLHVLIKEVTYDLDNYNFSSAEEKLREFTLNDLADWYLEANKFEKSEQKEKILYHILKNLLILWHPFIPFITEAIWEKIKESNLLIVQKWPEKVSTRIENNFEIIKNVITAIRNARAENKIEPAKVLDAVIYAGNKFDIFKTQEILLASLRTRISPTIKKSGEKIKDAIFITVSGIEIYLINVVNKAKEKTRLEKEIDNLKKIIKATENKLANKEFLAKAPVVVVKKEKDKLAGRKTELDKFQEQIKNL